MDWEMAAGLLAERETRPVAVLDRRGRIGLVNAAFTSLLGLHREELVGRRWSEACAPGERGPEVQRVLKGLFHGTQRALQSEVLTRGGQRLAVELDASPVGRPPSTLILVVTRSALAEPPPPPSMTASAGTPLRTQQEFGYEISTGASDFGQLKAMWGAAHPGVTETSRQFCFQEIAHRETPCPDCPVSSPASRSWPRTMVRPSQRGGAGFEIITASLVDGGSVRLDIHTIGESTVSELFEAKVRRLSERANLSEREGSVLHYLVLGRVPGEIALTLGITERTVKFHQANLLRKLGADTRFDLFRLLF